MYRVLLPGAVVESGDAAAACVPRSPFPVLLRKAERLMHVGSPHMINPDNADVLYKFVLTRISGEPRTAITHRNLESWTDLREFHRNTYTEKRTLDFHATQLFGARQGRNKSITEWIQTIQKLSSKFRAAAFQDSEDDERVGIVTLADKLRNICFVQGIFSDRIQTIVRSRNGRTFDEIVETALEEESAIFSKSERYKQGNTKGKLYVVISERQDT